MMATQIDRKSARRTEKDIRRGYGADEAETDEFPAYEFPVAKPGRVTKPSRPGGPMDQMAVAAELLKELSAHSDYKPAGPARSSQLDGPGTVEHDLGTLEHGLVNAAMILSAGHGKTLNAESARHSLAKLKRRFGNPEDPIADQMIEQLTISHLAVMHSHILAKTSETIDGEKTHLLLACRLQAEYRRTALALRSLRNSEKNCPRDEQGSNDVGPDAEEAQP